MPDETLLTLSPSPEADPLAAIRGLMQKFTADEEAAAEQIVEHDAARTAVSLAFSRVCDHHVRPVMEAALQQLGLYGGGGVVVERPENLRLQHDHRLTLWMSLRGNIEGRPREDRHPYLQLDANSGGSLVTVSEGDMWDGRGGNRSGRVAERPITDITEGYIKAEIVSILGRSVG